MIGTTCECCFFLVVSALAALCAWVHFATTIAWSVACCEWRNLELGHGQQRRSRVRCETIQRGDPDGDQQRRGSDVIQSKTIAFTPQEPKERNQTDQSWPTIAVVQFHSSSSFDLVVSSLSVRLSHRTEPLVPLSSVSRALPQLSSPFPRLPFITNLAPRNPSTPSSSPISVY